MTSSSKEHFQTLLCSVSVGLIGIGFIIGGKLWWDSIPAGGCPCNSVYCCAFDKTCPHDTPCLCVSVDEESTNGACAPSRLRDVGSANAAKATFWYGIVMALPLGFLLAGLALLLAVLAVHVINELLVRLAKCVMAVCRAIKTAIQKLYFMARAGSYVRDTELSNIPVEE